MYVYWGVSDVADHSIVGCLNIKLDQLCTLLNVIYCCIRVCAFLHLYSPKED